MDGDFINAKNKLIYITFSNVFHMAPTAFEGRRPEYIITLIRGEVHLSVPNGRMGV